MIQPKKATTLAGEMYDVLRADILACRLAPGAKIRINELCARFEVSLSAIREALSKLSAEGLVIAEAQRGYQVADVSAEDLRDLTETRVDVENLCLMRSIEHGSVEWETAVVAALHRLNRTPYRTESDPDRLNDLWVAAHHALHEALVSACGSDRLLRIRAQLYDQSERYRRLSVPLYKNNRNVGKEHGQIAEAALARDAALATKLMAAHLRKTMEILLHGMKQMTPAAA